MSKFSGYLCFLIFSLSVCVKGYAQVESGAAIDDYDLDGYADTITLEYEGGSGFGGVEASLTNGNTGEVFYMNTDGCFCDFIRFVRVPPELRKMENAPFLEALKSKLLPPCRKQVDPSLDWMIKGNFSHVLPEGNAFFDLLIDPQQEWLYGTPEVPDNYCIELRGDSLKQLYNSPFERELDTTDLERGAFLMYLAHNHLPMNAAEEGLRFDFLVSNELYTIESTQHALLVKAEDRYKWLFISDASFSGAPDKLRWKSMKHVWLKDHYVILQQTVPTNDGDRLYVIEIESGFCARLNGRCATLEMYDQQRPFDREEGKFIVETGDGIQIIEWSDVKRELELQMTNLRSAR